MSNTTRVVNMETKMSKEELVRLTSLLNSYNLSPTGQKLRIIYENLDRIGQAVEWARQYIHMLKLTGKENGKKPYAEKLLNSCERFVELTKNEQKMITLQKMDIYSSSRSVSERLK